MKESGGARAETRGRVTAALAACLAAAALFWPASAAGDAPELRVVPAPGSVKAYVVLHDESVLAVVDTAANRLLQYVPVPLGPRGLAMTPDGHKLYVGSDALGVVTVLDTASDRIVSTIDVGRTPQNISVSPDGRRILVSVWEADEVVLLDPSTDRIDARIRVARPDRSAISPDGRTAYVASAVSGSPSLMVLDLVKRVPVGEIPLPGSPQAVGLNRDGQRLYVTVLGAGAVHVLDTRGRSVVATVDAGAPYGLGSAPSAFGQLVLSRGRNALEMVDPVRNTVIATVPVGRLPFGLAIGGGGQLAYVTDEGSGDVSVVDLPARRVRTTIRVDTIGGAAREIVVQPAP